MDLTIKINLDNAAFEGDLSTEIQYCLDVVVDKIADGKHIGKIIDSNGNSVGSYVINY